MSIGLVFSGGGGKGAYEIGVWKALKEFGIAEHITSVSGTSVGALNAALFTQGDYDIAERTWLKIKQSDILHVETEKLESILRNRGVDITPVSFKYFSKGIFSRSALTRIIRQNFDYSRIDFNKRKLFVSCSSASVFPWKNKIFDCGGLGYEKVEKVLLASSAIPFLFGAENIDGTQYVDGYFTDNTPVKPLYDAGARIIFTVFLGRGGGLFDDCYVDRREFPDATIINLVPQEDLGGLFSGVLNFSGMQAKIDKGYQDASRILSHHRAILDSQMRIHNALIRLSRPAIGQTDTLNRKLQIDTVTRTLEQAQLENKLKYW